MGIVTWWGGVWLGDSASWLPVTIYLIHEPTINIPSFFDIKIKTENTPRSCTRRKPPQATMPLVVPGLMGSNNNDNNEQETWMNKLVGKKLTDDSTSDNTVRNPFSVL